MMRPDLASIIDGRNACMHITGPRTLTFITRSQRLSGVSWKSAGELIAGVVHEDVAAAELLERAQGHLADLLLARDVQRDGERASALELRPRRAVSSIVPGSFDGAVSERAGGDDDVRAGLREVDRDLLADAAAGAGHDGDLVLQGLVCQLMRPS